MGSNLWLDSHSWRHERNQPGYFISVEQSYEHDPGRPVPTVGGNNLTPLMGAGPRDQRSIEVREDVVVWSSDVLERDCEVEGLPQVKLQVTSDAVEFDLHVRLCDVYPDGRSMLVADGVRRTTGGTVTVDLPPIAITFLRGHRLRLILSGSNYPRYELNPKPGRQSVTKGELLLPIRGMGI
jgi:putative CocE/NonD family hydrolase